MSVASCGKIHLVGFVPGQQDAVDADPLGCAWVRSVRTFSATDWGYDAAWTALEAIVVHAPGVAHGPDQGGMVLVQTPDGDVGYTVRWCEEWGDGCPAVLLERAVARVVVRL